MSSSGHQPGESREESEATAERLNAAQFDRSAVGRIGILILRVAPGAIHVPARRAGKSNGCLLEPGLNQKLGKGGKALPQFLLS